MLSLTEQLGRKRISSQWRSLLRAFFWACFFSLALSSTSSFAGPHDPHSLDYRGYDSAIRAAVRAEWPEGPSWRWWKAQLYQESRLDRFAISPVGAEGLCQVMPATALDWAKDWFQLDQWGGISPHDAVFCIVGGAKYMRQLQRWPAWRGWLDLEDRHRMAQAAYNAGMGNINKALTKCRAMSWAETVACLPAVTGKHSKETIDYVTRIDRWYRQLVAMPVRITAACLWRGHVGGCGPVKEGKS